MIEVSLVNIFHLTVKTTTESSTALYLIMNGEVVEQTSYKKINNFNFFLRKPGNYTVRWFKKNANGRVSRGESQTIKFSGFSGIEKKVSSVNERISLYGINPFTLYAALVISEKHEVAGVIDPEGKLVGQEFFSIPVISIEDSGNTRVIRYNSDRLKVSSANSFSTIPGREDLLTNTLQLFSIIELYRLEHKFFNLGLLEGAKHIQGFIFNKFNCRIPYQARIGDGTRIGIGGIGVVIHPNSIIGRNCVISQQVTLGGRAGGNGTPVVGDNVWISPGAKCLGGKIGDNVVIGANSVVLHEVESNTVVAGVPAKVISRDISKYQAYTGKAIT